MRRVALERGVVEWPAEDPSAPSSVLVPRVLAQQNKAYLISKTVFPGFSAAWFFAGIPTSLCPSGVNATNDGVVLSPYRFGMISAVPLR